MLHSFSIYLFIYLFQANMLLFYNDHTINLELVGKKKKIYDKYL